MTKACEVVAALQGRTLCVAESCTGGLLGAELTAVSGASQVFKGGIISYTNEIKQALLGVSADTLARQGAVSAPVAMEMASGARKALNTDFALSVTGLAGPGGDEYGNPVGTVFIGFADNTAALSREFHFSGSREEVRAQAVEAALTLLMEYL